MQPVVDGEAISAPNHVELMAAGSPLTVTLKSPAPYRQQIPSPYVPAISKVYAPSAMYVVFDTARHSRC
jgi:hypothetical protein